jgi:DNA-binding MarR family transcriptional regulator
MPDRTLLDLEQFLPYRLSVLSNRISQDIARLYADRFGLGITEWRVLAVLGRYPGLSAGQLAERTAMDKVAVSRAVASLLAAGRVTRDTHGDDRRRSVLELSQEGHRVYAEVAPAAIAYERRLLACLSPEDQSSLSRLLQQLADAEQKTS